MSRPRWIVRLLACAALLAALAPAWAAAIHFASGQWRPDVCDGGGPRTGHAAPHDCCAGSADPAMPAPVHVPRQDVAAAAAPRLSLGDDQPAPRFLRGFTRAPPALP